MRKASFILAEFSYSGVPLAQFRLANAFIKKGYEVDVLICCGDILNFKVDERVNIIYLQNERVSKSFFKISSYLKSAKPEIVFSSEDHLNIIVLLAAIFSRSSAKISCSSRVHPLDKEAYSTKPLSKGWIMLQLMRLVSYRANVLSCVSEDMVYEYRRLFRRSRHQAIYNIIVNEENIQRSLEQPPKEFLKIFDKNIIVSAGRLDPEKGFDDLIVAFSKIYQSIKHDLMIIGEGREKNNLINKINLLGLNERVSLVGYQSNPLSFFSNSDIFVLPSYGEGMPNVLIEALLSGCTLVAYDCPTGPREVIQEDKFGYLVPLGNVDHLAASILKAIENPIKQNKASQILDQFSEENILNAHLRSLGE